MNQATPVTPELLRDWPLPSLADADGKEDRGRVLVIAGARSLPGAARLAGEAALRAGAGKLQVATAAGCGIALGLLLPEAKVTELPTGPGGEMRRADAPLRRSVALADAVLVGPGMAEGVAARRLAAMVLANSRSTCVLDCGAMAAALAGPRPRRPPVITPHAGEMAALLDRSVDEIRSEPARWAREVARRSGAVIVLKGATTHIASPDGRRWIHEGGGIGLGTSGSGDVLAGLIVGLAARGATAEQAAAWAVALHGRAGDRLSQATGPLGFLAREIAAQVPPLLEAWS